MARLRTATTFDFESNASTYSIRVRAKDEHNASIENNFTVMLLDIVTEGPPIQIDGNSTEVKTTGTLDGTNWVKKKTITLPPSKRLYRKLEMKSKTTPLIPVGLRNAKLSLFTVTAHPLTVPFRPILPINTKAGFILIPPPQKKSHQSKFG